MYSICKSKSFRVSERYPFSSKVVDVALFIITWFSGIVAFNPYSLLINDISSLVGFDIFSFPLYTPSAEANTLISKSYLFAKSLVVFFVFIITGIDVFEKISASFSLIIPLYGV